MSRQPAVTVLMPVFNGERFLRPAIESILAQSCPDFEFLIVDDGSTDGTAGIVRSYSDPRIRFERFERNRGLSAALNFGVAQAAAPIIARQDADDLSHPERLEVQLDLMTGNRDLVLAGSQARTLDESNRVIGDVRRPVDDLSIRWYALFDNPFIHTAVVFRRAAVLACGQFDAAFDPFSQDYAMWWRLMRAGRVVNLSDELVDYRVNAESIIGRIGESDAGEYSATFGRVVRELVTRHMLEAYGSRGLQPDEAALMSGFVLGIDAEALPRFLAIVDRLASWFEEEHPAVRQSRDYRRTLARQFDAIASRARPGTRGQAFQVYAHALRSWPRLVSVLPWPRLIATTAFGRDGRARLARLWTRAARA
jgi:hypothetical protein